MAQMKRKVQLPRDSCTPIPYKGTNELFFVTTQAYWRNQVFDWVKTVGTTTLNRGGDG
jgi:hypothetical protein